jgi:hypothetical protein
MTLDMKGTALNAQRSFTGDDLPGRSISIDALLAADGKSPNVQPGFNALQIIQAADVILGMDVMTRNTFIVIGRDFLKEIAEGTRVSQPSLIVKVELDEQTDELPRLVALVESVRGRHEFRAGDR